MSSSDAYLSLRAWSHHHRPALLWASRNAFDFKNHPTRMSTTGSVFVVVVDVTPAAISGAEQDPVRMFSLQEATLMEKQHLPAFHPQAAVLVATTDNHHAQTNTDAALTLVFCPGVAINLIPSLDVLSHGPETVKDWKTFLIPSTRLNECWSLGELM
ncbi:hypothetical protein FIBSPDRAFT_1012348 [Athelia psychrophila]|uniref:Uncharacterized protein n=1 Tax=Athelia psychrophila TaxID=1759441 RepID=A0A166MJ59_9AGAM|nr:hypothetical protein FIBSPDRAFT_1012348 [Fibularhizoctonia sp. CBS 109695]